MDEPRWAVALYNFEGEGEHELLSFKEGDILRVVTRDSDWWPATIHKLANGDNCTVARSGYVPRNYIELHDNQVNSEKEEFESDEDLLDSRQEALALYDFQASQPDQLSFLQGDSLYVIVDENAEWWSARLHGNEGMVPHNYVEVVDSEYSDEDETQFELAIAKYSHEKQSERELSFRKGNRLWVIPNDNEEWWAAKNERGDTGRVPATYITVFEDASNWALKENLEWDIFRLLFRNCVGITNDVFHEILKNILNANTKHPLLQQTV